MVKKPVAGHELGWLLLEALKETGRVPIGLTLAVVPDRRTGWRAVVASLSQRFVTASVAKRLAKVEQQLQSRYVLATYHQSVKIAKCGRS